MPKITIDGIDYEVEVRNGERFIGGMSLDDFLDTLSAETLTRLAKVGWYKLLNGKDDEGFYQEKLSEIEFLEY